ncbi:hypothetical protein V6N11_021398 [Hibiscus sabdariffa]|uniref:Uncharacterized protein n=2 Tax=Hibiscus sabdariffa TaxID=183260 RepID=A0ABR1ZWX3_9ROSI
MLIAFFVGFFAGIFVILGLELVAVLVVVNILNRRIQRRIEHETKAAAAAAARNPQHSLDSICNTMQGVVWVLDQEKMSSKEQKRKRDSEVSPVRKHAKIQDQYLTLTSSDSSSIFIPLKGCIIQAVSATSLSSRKWAKRYPIKVESKSCLYNGNKTIYLYLETAWEKESWCKVLRLASCEDNGKLNWFAKLNVDFQAYIALLSTGYTKPSLGFGAESMDKGSKSDGSISKVKLFWRKLSRKNSKPIEIKGNLSSQSAHEETKACEKQHSFQDSVSNKASNSSTEENTAFTSPQDFPRSASQGGASGASDADSEHEKLNNDEGVLCWNLLISRVFFDIKANAELKSSLQARIQRTLSTMRTPNYIGEVICTKIDIGNRPPYIHAMRLHGKDMNEVSAFEVDAEYSGGALIDVETRIEVRDQDFQKGIVDTNSESNLSSDLLEGFEHFGKHLNLNKEDFLLKIVRVVSLRGTLRLYIKPPPSDQLWFGFTSMPDVELVVESSVGDHKITNGHIALFLINRFKAAIRDTMVLPNCESACIPWMLAEKDDWIPRNVAPYVWLKEGGSDKREAPPQVTESKANGNSGNTSNCDLESKSLFRASTVDSTARLSTTSLPVFSSCPSYSSLHALETTSHPTIDELHEARPLDLEGTSNLPSAYSRSMRELGSQGEGSDDNSSQGPKTGRRAKLRDLRKRIGEKFGEKKRHMVERMKSKEKDRGS